MNKNYEEPAIYISMFDDEDVMLTDSTGVTGSSAELSAEEQAGEAIGSNVSVYSVDINEKN